MAVLEHRRQQQLRTRERRREKPVTRCAICRSSSVEERRCAQERELALLLAVTSGRGFVTQQLRNAALSPLARWFHQLQLLALDGASPRRCDADGADDDNALAAALLALERALGDDDATATCYDVRFAPNTRSARDAAAELLDGDVAENARGSVAELLSFSTMKRGRVCRVTCVHLSGGDDLEHQYPIHSSLYVRDLETRASQLLQSPASDVSNLLELIWSELAP